MATTRAKAREDGAERIIESLEDTEKATLEAVRKFLDTVNGAFPHTGTDGGTRQKIIDSAFKMTEELIGTSNDLVQRLVKIGSDAAERGAATVEAARKTVVERAPARSSAARRAPSGKPAGTRAPASKSTANRSPAKKAPARKAPAKRTTAARASG